MARRPLTPQQAWNRLNRAVYQGKVVRPDTCSQCGRNDLPIQAHHDDYQQPLKVDWLCPPCHQQRHRPVVVGADCLVMARQQRRPKFCATCGADLPVSEKRGKPRQYCSVKCRVAAYRARQDAATA